MTKQNRIHIRIRLATIESDLRDIRTTAQPVPISDRKSIEVNNLHDDVNEMLATVLRWLNSDLLLSE